MRHQCGKPYPAAGQRWARAALANLPASVAGAAARCAAAGGCSCGRGGRGGRCGRRGRQQRRERMQHVRPQWPGPVQPGAVGWRKRHHSLGPQRQLSPQVGFVPCSRGALLTARCWVASVMATAISTRPLPFSCRSLEPLRALRGLRALRVAGSGLSSLQGVESLSHLTSLDASHNALGALPSLEGWWGRRGCWFPGSTAAATHACKPVTTKPAAQAAPIMQRSTVRPARFGRLGQPPHIGRPPGCTLSRLRRPPDCPALERQPPWGCGQLDGPAAQPAAPGCERQ